jgi:hypothetical protein
MIQVPNRYPAIVVLVSIVRHIGSSTKELAPIAAECDLIDDLVLGREDKHRMVARRT